MTDYGRCPCGGWYEARSVRVSFSVGRQVPLDLDAVPQGACPVCGSRVYKAELLERIEAIYRNEPSDRFLRRIMAPS
jgi:hypothetical protein